MHPDIASKKAELAELAQRFGVTRLEVFGSAAR
jgi:predicted nucleotidyltransferase